MEIKVLRPDLKQYLIKHNLNRKFTKQIRLLKENPQHPSLNLERLEPKHLKLYSFRINKQYRAIFIITTKLIEIVDINNYYH